MDAFVEWWRGVFAEGRAAGLGFGDMSEPMSDFADDLPDGLSPVELVALAVADGASRLDCDLRQSDLVDGSRTSGCVGWVAADGSMKAACVMVVDGRLVA